MGLNLYMKVRHCSVAGVSHPGQRFAGLDHVTGFDTQRPVPKVCKHNEQPVVEFDNDYVACRIGHRAYATCSAGILHVVSREHDLAINRGQERLLPTVCDGVTLRFSGGVEHVPIFQSYEIDGEPLIVCGKVVILQRARSPLQDQPLSSKWRRNLHRRGPTNDHAAKINQHDCSGDDHRNSDNGVGLAWSDKRCSDSDGTDASQYDDEWHKLRRAGKTHRLAAVATPQKPARPIALRNSWRPQFKRTARCGSDRSRPFHAKPPQPSTAHNNPKIRNSANAW